MRKRISCKVIRTIPLGTRIEELCYTSRSKDKSHNINNRTSTSNTNQHVWETTTNPRVKDFGKSVIYTERLDIKRISVDNGPTTSIFNYYA
jgi:hypothetical protein